MAEQIVVMHLRACNFVGGPEKQILEQLVRIDKEKFRTIVGTFIAPGEEDRLGMAARKLQTATFPIVSKSPIHPASVKQLLTILRRENVSILCTHGYRPNIIGCFAAKAAGIATIAVSRGWTAESGKIRMYERLDRFFLRLSSHVVAVSHGQKEKVVRCGVPENRVSVIHNAIDVHSCAISPAKSVRRELGIPEDSIWVVSAGRLSPEKNYSTMIEVARQVASKKNNVFFTVFGEGFLRNTLEEQRDRAGLQNRFLFPGFRADIASAFAEMDIFMLPSLTEGLPNVVLEAYSMKKPVIASAVGGTPEIVQHNISGKLSAPYDVTTMAEAILRFSNDDNLRGCMGNAGFSYVQENFSFSKQTLLYQALYETVYHRRHARPQ